MPGEAFTFFTAGNLAGTFDEVTTVGRDDIYFSAVYTTGANGFVQAAVQAKGDMNPFVPGLDESDIQVFALGLRNPLAYRSTYGVSAATAGSLDGYAINGFDPLTYAPDNDLDFDDINDFAALMAGVSGMGQGGVLDRLHMYLSVPEPASAVLFAVGSYTILAGSVRRRPRRCASCAPVHQTQVVSKTCRI
jgi:hypothetical protein